MRNKNYEAPQCEVIEIEIEGMVLAASVNVSDPSDDNLSVDFGYGGLGW